MHDLSKTVLERICPWPAEVMLQNWLNEKNITKANELMGGFIIWFAYGHDIMDRYMKYSDHSIIEISAFWYFWERLLIVQIFFPFFFYAHTCNRVILVLMNFMHFEIHKHRVSLMVSLAVKKIRMGRGKRIISIISYDKNLI